MLTEPYRCVKWSVKWFLFLFLFLASQAIFAEGPQSTPSIFAPASTPANSIYELSLFVIAITGGIFVTVGSLIAWAAFRFRQHGQDDTSEPAQIMGPRRLSWPGRSFPSLLLLCSS